MTHLRKLSEGLKGLPEEYREDVCRTLALAQTSAKQDLFNDVRSAWSTYISAKKGEVTL
jgi:hypothetical protein